jgi:hypothetical protein
MEKKSLVSDEVLLQGLISKIKHLPQGFFLEKERLILRLESLESRIRNNESIEKEELRQEIENARAFIQSSGKREA